MHDAHFSKGRPNLSARALSVWAKSVYLNPGDDHYLQLWQHLEDTGEIALLVWNKFVGSARTLAHFGLRPSLWR